jgi:hypothetical protein
MMPRCLSCQQEMVAVFTDSAIPAQGAHLYAYQVFHCAQDGTLCKCEREQPKQRVWLFAHGAVLVLPQAAHAEAPLPRHFA